jgi:hypothetical protein
MKFREQAGLFSAQVSIVVEKCGELKPGKPDYDFDILGTNPIAGPRRTLRVPAPLALARL